MAADQRLALAGLLHDLPGLLAGAQLGEGAQLFLELVREVDGQILKRAEGFAGGAGPLVTDRPLRAITSLVQLDDTEPRPAYRALTPLDSAQDGVLIPQTQQGPVKRQAYLQALADQLDWIAEKVGINNEALAYTHLLATLQRYGWCLPAHQADVSLYDHARLTSAVAVCLAQTGEQAEPLRLLVGDVSGIQNYIFDIAAIGAGGVARRLRARSLQIALLADVVAHSVAHAADVPLGNVLMSSGGKFYVLIPNSEAVTSAIDMLHRRLEQWLYNTYGGELTIILASLPLSGTQLAASTAERPGFGEMLGALGQLLGQRRMRAEETVLIGPNGWNEQVFLLHHQHVSSGVPCESCRRRPAEPALRTALDDADLCTPCHRDLELGRNLPETAYIAYYRSGSPTAGSLPLFDGYAVRLLTNRQLHTIGSPYLITKLNSTEIPELAPYPGSFRMIANSLPINTAGSQASFEEIADQADGRSMLGYLKADVDRLGTIFAYGLRRDTEHKDSAGHILALSREMDLFFSMGIAQIVRKKDYDWTYTIFSGGDDLFLVGPWDRSLKLGREIREEFGRFTAGNPDMTISLGILFAKPRYPIYRAARDAEEILEHAKEHSWRDVHGQLRNRNQLAILGTAMSWPTADTIIAEIDRLLPMAKGRQLTSALLYSLITYSEMYRRYQDQHEVIALRYKPMFAYNIARNLREKDTPSVLYEWADMLLRSLHGGGESLIMRHMGLIATYLIFSIRESRKEVE